jgi:nicotinate-nucleotide adenylyltransferase
MRLGILGGSFDPIHYGHLLLAETCREQCCLDQVIFMPAAVPPHKSRELTAADARVEMLELALSGHPSMRVSKLEVERGGVSYTVETLTGLRRDYPDAQLFFLMGADSLADLPTWREPQRICQLAVPLVVRRAGSVEPDFGTLVHLVDAERLGEIRECQVAMPVIDLSSTEIRHRVASGMSIRYRTPRAVEMYIQAARLYATDCLNGAS